MAPSAQSRHVLLLVLLAVMWASSVLIIKIAVAELPPLSLSAWRLVIAALVLFAVVRLRRLALPRAPRLWAWFLLLGTLGNGLPFALIAWGEIHIDSALAAILIAAMPLFALVLAHFFTSDERLNALRAGGVALGFVGILVLVGPTALAGLGSDVLGQLAITLAAACYAVAGIVIKRVAAGPPAVMTACVLACAAAVFLPLSLLIDRPWELQISAGTLAATLALGVWSTALPLVIYFYLIANAGVTFAALSNYLIPVLAVFLGALLLDEMISLEALAALALILAGVAAVNLANLRRTAA